MSFPCPLLLVFWSPTTRYLSLLSKTRCPIGNSCSAPGYKSNYYESDDRNPVFKMLTNPAELRQAWIRALRSDNIDHILQLQLLNPPVTITFQLHYPRLDLVIVLIENDRSYASG